MIDKIRVYNKTKFHFGVQTPDNREFNIRPGSFILLTQDDIAFIESVARDGKKPFATGKLAVDKKQEPEVFNNASVIVDPSNVLMDDKDIQQRLKQSAANIKKWIGGIQDTAILRTVAEVAARMDLPNSKIKIITEFIPWFVQSDTDE